MTITIIDRNGLLTDELWKFAERRLYFALSRFDSRIKRVSLVVSDQNGPRGGIDKSCRLTVTLKQANDVVIAEQDSGMEACIARVAERGGRSVSRVVDRAQRIDRAKPKFLDPLEEV